MAGFMMRRNLIVVFMSVEIMLNAGGLALITFARLHGGMEAHVFFFFILALAAAESAVGLAMVIAVYRKKHRLDPDALSDLRG
jgi:NADH-quinone oxidoreductase subunit K